MSHIMTLLLWIIVFIILISGKIIYIKKKITLYLFIILLII